MSWRCAGAVASNFALLFITEFTFGIIFVLFDSRKRHFVLCVFLQLIFFFQPFPLVFLFHFSFCLKTQYLNCCFYVFSLFFFRELSIYLYIISTIHIIIVSNFISRFFYIRVFYSFLIKKIECKKLVKLEIFLKKS